ncbi:alpha/beta hydrolase fold [Geosmithia morbida]|uniref:Alpha/beta hydrolase fold n=1 Tax=Geosmithia morbida TaxID=1094350 RepID=A0A9P4Z296_9HYPO|nr:alpha/beta hydrolase fold [Geosmithia morbida]KAF4126099.1 alpha/beta hydrolase fold [Geosmithia morbida]
MTSDIVLPRPGAAPSTAQASIPGPTEAAFTDVFGKLLPPADFLETGHGKAAYYRLTASTAQPSAGRVLFVHGIQTPALGMYPLAAELRKTHPGAELVLVDLWGHGLSDTPVLPHDPALFHGLIDALLDRLEWPSAHLVGYSMGAALSVGYTAGNAQRVRSLTLVAPAGMISSSLLSAEQRAHVSLDCADEPAAERFIVGFLEGGERVVPADWKDRVSRGEVVAEAVREWQALEHRGHSASVVAAFRDAGVMDAHDQFDKAAATGVATLAVLGETDVLSSARELGEHGLTNVRVIRGADHGVVRSEVPQVAAHISDFWARYAEEI